jgi:hypothetical protein
MITNTLKTWLPLAATVTLLCGVMYILVQQNYRSNANDPQVQMAEDAAYALSNGADPKALVSDPATEISRSLKPYIIIYDDQGHGVAADGLLDGKIPGLPSGVLDFTRTHDEDVISWQPRIGTRSALVIKYVQGSFRGFVVAGRSLRMTEERESMLTKQVAFGWIVSLGLLLIVVILTQVIFKT